MKKKVLTLRIILSLLIVVLCLWFDFNTYKPQSKSIPCEDHGIIFSITTFDGKTESKPFVRCLGHTWVSIDNQSGHSVRLKDHEIKNDEIITFSVWAVSGHRGLFFNLESNFIIQYDRYVGRQSLSINIDESKLRTIEDYIEDHHNWTLVKNCSCWAIQLWNQIVDEDYQLKTQTLVYTPQRLQKSMREYDCTETNRDFSRSGGIFYYQDGFGKEWQLCSPKKELCVS